MTTQAHTENASPHTPENIIVKATLLATSTLTVMAGATVAPSLPAMQAFFADVPNGSFWVRLVLTLPALFIVVGAPIAGYIIDTFGRKRLLVAATLLYAVAGGSGFIAGNLWLILVGRAFLGLAVAGVMTSVTTLIADYFTGQARSRFLGLQAAAMGFGGTVFLSLSGVLADINWRVPFLIYALALTILPFIITQLYEPQRELADDCAHKHLADPSDCAAEAQRTAAQQPDREQAPIRTPVGLMAFIYGTVVLVQVVFYLVPVQLPFYLQSLTGASAAQTGLAIAAMTLSFAVASSLFGWFDQRFDHVTVLLVAFLLLGSGYILVAQASGWLLVGIGLPLSGFGIGLLQPNLNVWLTNETPTALRGRALGGFTTAVFLGQFLSPFASQPISTTWSFAAAFGLFGAAVLVLMLLLFGLRGQVARLAVS